MKMHVLQSGGTDRLYLFFCGWATPPTVVAHLKAPEGVTVMACSDYTDLSFPAALSGYTEIRIIAWSLGVWAADTFFSNHPLPGLVSATAINGTPYPADDENGIPLAVYQGTAAHLSEETLCRFKQRMCGSSSVWENYRQLEQPQRSVESLKKELEAILFCSLSGNRHTARPAFPWTKAILSTGDRIFPFKNQQRYWSNRSCDIQNINAPHYPFYLWNQWSELTE